MPHETDRNPVPGKYFCNRNLFADHYLLTRLREDAAWRDDPAGVFQHVQRLVGDAPGRWRNRTRAVVREQLFEPLFELLGFKLRANKDAHRSHTAPDYLLSGSGGRTAAFVCAWDRWLDGPDFDLDQQSPEANPGAGVVTALDEGVADWIIMTNGRLWRLYSRQAHSRATNFYQVDLLASLVAFGDNDSNGAFRYWWLFFRAGAFAPAAGRQGCWLDTVAAGSRDFAHQLGQRLKQRIVERVFPHLAGGFLENRRLRLGKGRPTEQELHDTFDAALTLLYRLLFLLYAESRDLLRIRDAPYGQASLSQIKQEIAHRAGIVETEVAGRLAKAYSAGETGLYQRLLAETGKLPGLASHEQRVARYLAEHRVPDRYLALAIDGLARDPDESPALVFVDYKSLEVRHLGAIYESLLEFNLRVGENDTTYLSNDKAERKSSGSYYTPDPIVEYIVEHTVGPVLAEKLESLRGEMGTGHKTLDQVHGEIVERLFDFRTLDPAMGSGHFLVKALDFITDRLLVFLNQFPVNPVRFMLDRMCRNILDALDAQGVSVDPDKLTEVNLLKRLVLKRCIYGVDLNPMAVELAKASLWLDAFTIGAPMPFLDHHLRCGNSLIGAAFEELEAATGGPLFPIDDQPLRRALRRVIQVNQRADATAAEVKRSATEYASARTELSGYQLALDLLVAPHFCQPRARGMFVHGSDLDLSSRDRLTASLADSERMLVEHVEALAGQPDSRFFHWETEFPEVFFSFAGADHCQVKHKDQIASGSAGFDAVVGNPPYLNVRLLTQRHGEAVKRFLEHAFTSARRGYDLYVLFIERGYFALRRSGAFGMIVPNKVATMQYAEGCRKLLFTSTSFRRIADLSNARVFGDASVYPYIIVAQKASPRDDSSFTMCVMDAMADFAGSATHTRLQRTHARASGWTLHGTLHVESRVTTIPLEQAARLQSGTTGFVAERVATALSERDDAPAGDAFEFIVSGNIDRYRITPGNVRYMNRRFDRPMLPENAACVSDSKRQLFRGSKLVIAGMTKRLEVAWDRCGVALGVQVYAAYDLSFDARVLLAILNSSLMTVVFRQQFQAKRLSGGYLAVNLGQLAKLPIRVFDLEDDSDRQLYDAITDKVDSLLAAIHAPDDCHASTMAPGIDREIDLIVCKCYGLNDREAAEVIASVGS